MARASIYTALSLDRWAKIMGVNPAHFNGGRPINLPDGRILFNMDNASQNIWPQYDWQSDDRVSRESLALAIQSAESEIEDFLGFNVAPKWTQGEVHQYEQLYDTGTDTLVNNPRFDGAGVTLKKTKVISGGRKETELIGRNPTIDYSDPDGDGWNELATITHDITGYTTRPIDEFHFFHDGYTDDETYEIRNPKSVSITGTTLTATFNTWQLVDPELYEVMPTDDPDGKSIDFSSPETFVTLLSVYRVYNDTTENHVEFIVTDTLDNTKDTYGGFISIIRPDQFVIPTQATYNSGTAEWEADCALYCDHMLLYYYSGNVDKKAKYNDLLDDNLARAIAYMATARLDKVFLSNNNTSALAVSLQEDLSNKSAGSVMYHRDLYTCPFGTRRGEFQAWQRIKTLREKRMGFATL